MVLAHNIQLLKQELKSLRRFFKTARGASTEARIRTAERKRMLEKSIGGKMAGIFESVEPLPSGGTVSSSEASPQGQTYSPNDPGVDIDGLMNIGGGHNWKKMI